MIEVYWSFITSTEIGIDTPECMRGVIEHKFNPFLSLTKEVTAVRKGVTFLKCPGHTDFLKNTFAFQAPMDITIELEIQDEKTSIFCENINQEIFDKIVDIRFLNDTTTGKTPYPLVGIDFLNAFAVSPNTNSMFLQVFPAFMHYNDFTSKATVIPGEFDIAKWCRPLELVFEIKNKKERIVIKKGDVLAYYKFNSDDTVKLKKGPTPWSDIALCIDLRKAKKFRPLKERYVSLAEAKRCPYDPKG
jgi:hypothetical protein